MRTTAVGQWWVRTVVALLTVVWVLTVLALLWRCFVIGMEVWADGPGRAGVDLENVHRRSTAALLLLASVAPAGAVLIAVTAFIGRMTRTAAVFLALAVVLGGLAVPVAAGAHRTTSPSPPPSEPASSQEHSGGDNRCPGD